MNNDCEQLYNRQGETLRRYVYAMLPWRGWTCAGNYTNPDDAARRLREIGNGKCFEGATGLRVITVREVREIIEDKQGTVE